MDAKPERVVPPEASLMSIYANAVARATHSTLDALPVEQAAAFAELLNRGRFEVDLHSDDFGYRTYAGALPPNMRPLSKTDFVALVVEIRHLIAKQVAEHYNGARIYLALTKETPTTTERNAARPKPE